jgi:hypothetical protein
LEETEILMEEIRMGVVMVRNDICPCTARP